MAVPYSPSRVLAPVCVAGLPSAPSPPVRIDSLPLAPPALRACSRRKMLASVSLVLRAVLVSNGVVAAAAGVAAWA